MVLNPTNQMVYLYYGDELSRDNQYVAGRIALASVKLHTLCTDAALGVHAPWKKWYRGMFSQPAVYTSAANREHLPAGTGGSFSPIISSGDETCPDVLYHGGKWYMVTSTAHVRLSLRTSSNGITWSAPRTVYVPPHGYVLYPYLWAVNQRGGMYATFTWQQDRPPWQGNFALEQVKVRP
jgi:hypothetical protein